MTDRAKIIDFYLAKISDKSFEISDVRKDLERNNYPEDEIRVIVRLIDNEMQRRLDADLTNKKARDLTYFGAGVAILGLFITIATYTRLIDMGNRFIISFGPILGGLTIMFMGLARRIRR